MTEIADDRSWWADVEHLRPGGESHRSDAPTGGHARPVTERSADDRAPSAESVDRPGKTVDRPGETARPAPRRARTIQLERDAPEPRRGRITGTPVEHGTRPRRPEVAAFADALDLHGAFGAPVTAPRSREIILTGGPAAHTDPADIAAALRGADGPTALEPVDRYLADVDAGAASADRKTVRITGNPGLHAQVAERRPLREIGERRPRSTVQRAMHHPDRIAMYVVLLGVFLVFVAAFTSSAGS